MVHTADTRGALSARISHNTLRSASTEFFAALKWWRNLQSLALVPFLVLAVIFSVGCASATAAPSATPQALSCTSGSISSPGNTTCNVTLSKSVRSGEAVIAVTSSAAGVSVPASVVVPAGSASAAFTVNVSSGLPGEAATLTATADHVAATTQLQVKSSAPAITVGVAPSGVSLQTKSTQQFTASVSGASNTAVSWTLSGAGCSGSSCGAITSTGLYTAPSAVPSPSTVTVTATSQQSTTASASVTVTITAPSVTTSTGTTYYIAPESGGGNDSHDGLSADTPWLTPNHAVNCGDVLIAAPGTYESSNFYNGQWGTVTCPSRNNVAWVKCATAFACSITDSSESDMFISSSFWGVQGFVFSTTGGSTSCVSIAPPYSTGAQIDHIIVANNIVGPCTFDGISTNNGYGTTPTTGVDYVAYIGNIVYNTGGNSGSCAAGLSFYSPVASDSAAGTHDYMAGNFAWGNTSNCGDGEGIIFDTIDGVEAGWPTSATYSQQMAAEDNLTVFNHGPGIQVDLNMNGKGPWAPIYFEHNTSAYNCQGPSDADYCANIVLGTTVTANASYNLVVAPTQFAFGGSSVTEYGSAAMYAPGTTNHISNEFAYSAYGTGVGSVGSPEFVAGSGNLTSTNPGLANPKSPGTPSCGSYATTAACMATVIANFTASNATAKSYGYQPPSSTPVADPLFPQWLCSASNLPSGLITMGCAP